MLTDYAYLELPDFEPLASSSALCSIIDPALCEFDYSPTLTVRLDLSQTSPTGTVEIQIDNLCPNIGE